MTSLLVVVACGIHDRTITRGADDEQAWTQRLAAAVPLMTPADSARAIMERNGFRCQAGADSVAYLWCDKEPGGATGVVRRRWQAVLNLDGQQRVFALRGSTGLIGP
jgi:hypothetical protein